MPKAHPFGSNESTAKNSPTGVTGPVGQVSNGKLRDSAGPKPSGIGTFGPTATPQSTGRMGK